MEIKSSHEHLQNSDGNHVKSDENHSNSNGKVDIGDRVQMQTSWKNTVLEWKSAMYPDEHGRSYVNAKELEEAVHTNMGDRMYMQKSWKTRC